MLRLIYDGIVKIGNSLQSPFLLVIRLFWGYQFAVTGFGKLMNLESIAAYFQTLGIPLPLFNATLTGCVELICGCLLFFGLFARIAALPLIIVTLVAYLTAEIGPLMTLFTQLNPTPFFNATPFLFFYAALIVFCFGPGKISIDNFLMKDETKEMP